MGRKILLFFFIFLSFFLLKSSIFPQEKVFLFKKSTLLFLKGEGEKKDFLATLPFKITGKNFLSSFFQPFPFTSFSLLSERREPFEYLVKEGDTIFKISRKFSLSPETILWANGLRKDSKLKVGQRLLILPTDGVLHFVSSGETIYKIAKKYKVSPEKIIAFNDISKEGKIFKGDVLIIPGGKPQFKKRKIIVLRKGYFIPPTRGIITQTLHFYNAIDIANRCGTKIVAPANGTVIEVGRRRLCGKMIKIEHQKNLITVYCHLSKIYVKEGVYLSKGEPIGEIGNTGRVHGYTGCHLHFSVIGAKNPLSRYRKGTFISY